MPRLAHDRSFRRCFGTLQDRVKAMRQAGVKSLEQANTYLEEAFLPLWNRAPQSGEGRIAVNGSMIARIDTQLVAL